YRRFLREYSQRAARPGPILDRAGQELGQHEGLAFYTIGQRKGLGITTGQPVFVLRKDVAHNALIVGTYEELGQQTLVARQVNWVNGRTPTTPLPVQIKIRYKAKAVEGMAEDIGDGRVRCTFHEPVFGITAGQAAVFYDGGTVLGGGIITEIEGLGDWEIQSLNLPISQSPRMENA
ncbi:MAG: hypothetical protein KF770_24060, partial [Anaerolineae bacterium]|nr:hypothetical protein [Anaerolineae bacterium]